MSLPLYHLPDGSILGPTGVTKPGSPLSPGASAATLPVIEASAQLPRHPPLLGAPASPAAGPHPGGAAG